MSPLSNPRHEIFAQGIVAGLKASEAYVKAGYKPSSSSACDLRKKPMVAARIKELTECKVGLTEKAVQRAVEMTGIDKAWVMATLAENVARAMQAKPVLNAEGNPVGEWKYEGAVANKALELIGKEIGMFVVRSERGRPGEFAHLSDAQLKEQFVQQLVERGMSGKKAREFVGATRGPGRPRKQPADA